jgi:RNA polymerase sigma-70 factor (ECF subfamily)
VPGPLKKNFSLTENSGFELSDGLLIAMVAGKVMTSVRLGPRGELLDNPDFNVIMEECMNDLPQKWKLAVTSILKRENSHLSGIRNNYV